MKLIEWYSLCVKDRSMHICCSLFCDCSHDWCITFLLLLVQSGVLAFDIREVWQIGIPVESFVVMGKMPGNEDLRAQFPVDLIGSSSLSTSHCDFL